MRWVPAVLMLAAVGLIVWGFIMPWANGKFDRFFKWVRAHVLSWRKRKEPPPNPLLEWHLARRALREAALNEWAVEFANLRRIYEPERFHQVQRLAEDGNVRSYGAWESGRSRLYAKGSNYSCHEKDIVTFQSDGGVIVTCWCPENHPPIVSNKRSIRVFNTMKGWD